MILETGIFIILTWVVFAKYPSPALVLTWGFMALFFVFYIMGILTMTSVAISLMFFLVALIITVMVSKT